MTGVLLGGRKQRVTGLLDYVKPLISTLFVNSKLFLLVSLDVSAPIVIIFPERTNA